MDLSIELGELSCAIKALSKDTTKNQSDFCHLMSNSWDLPSSKFIRHIKRIPLEFPVPEQISPEADSCVLKLTPTAPARMENKALQYGLHALMIIHPEDAGKPIISGDDPAIGEHCQICGCHTSRRHVHIWKWHTEKDYNELSLMYFALKSDLKKFYKFLTYITDEEIKQIDPPILPPGVLSEVYKNSIEFLRNGRDLKDTYAKYKIPFKRGILLCGKPGSGKTLCCKWLKYLCRKNDILTKVVNLPQYERIRQTGSVSSLFKFDGNRPGIVFFDDMDAMVQNRQKVSSDLQTFLSEMDGINPAEGVVYIFTTNFIEELDEAFVRPGRIDLFLTFREPNKQLREKFIKERFQEEILRAADEESLTVKTEGYTFAEIEEIRKLFVFEILAGREISVEKIFKTFESHRTEFAERKNFGFNKLEDDEKDYYDDNGFMDLLKEELR